MSSLRKIRRTHSLSGIRKLTPIQMPHVDMDEVKNGRKAFTKDGVIDVMLRSTGM